MSKKTNHRTTRAGRPPRAGCQAVRTPDAVAVAQSILAGKEPSDLYWNLKPHCKVIEDESGASDTYLNPKLFFAPPCDWHSVSAKTIPNFATERAIELNPAYRARLLEHAILDSLRVLNWIAEDTLGQLLSNRSQEITANNRLRSRLAAAVHDELKALLDDWNQLNQKGGDSDSPPGAGGQARNGNKRGDYGAAQAS